MKKVFEQKRGFNYRKHTLYDNRIVVETRTLSKIEKYEVGIDQTGTELHYQADNTTLKKIVIVICLLIPVVLTVIELFQNSIETKTLAINYICWFVLATVFLLMPHQDDVFVTGGEKNLVFYRNVPSEREVLKFIREITEASKDYTKSKYVQFDENTDEDEYFARLTWLKDSEIITQEEFEEYKIDFEIKRLF